MSDSIDTLGIYCKPQSDLRFFTGWDMCIDLYVEAIIIIVIHFLYQLFSMICLLSGNDRSHYSPKPSITDRIGTN